MQQSRTGISLGFDVTDESTQVFLRKSWTCKIGSIRVGRAKVFGFECNHVKVSKDVTAADYRNHAENHGCVWKKAGPLPQHIGHTVNEILTRSRDSPLMTVDEAHQWAAISQETTDLLEPDLSAAFYRPGFIPQLGHPGGTLTLSQEIPSAVFPKILYAEGSLPASKPDCSWGYSKGAFTNYQELGRNNKYSPIKDRDTRLQREFILPGFIWEFKSQAAQGSIYVAVNQVIGSGAACVKALNTLYQVAQKQGLAERAEADTIAFSVVLDGQFANLNVHWFQDLEYMAQRHRSYRLCEADDISEFFNHCKNILTYLYGPRHQRIATALTTLFKATFVNDKHRHNIGKGCDAYTKAQYNDMMHNYMMDQKAQGIQETASAPSPSDSDATTAESQITAESQTTISMLQVPQATTDSFLGCQDTQKRRRESTEETDARSRKRRC